MSETSVPSAGLRRDLDLLRELAGEEALRGGGLGVVALAERLGRNASQVSRALHALLTEGMVERDERTRTFRLGWGVYALAARGVHTRLLTAAGPRLRVLAEQQGRPVALVVLVAGGVQTVLVLTPGGGLPPGGVPWGGSAAARAALRADWPDDLVDDPEERDRIARVRRDGHVVEPPGHDGGGATATIAAPVRDFRGVVVAAVELAADAGVAATVQQAAQALSADLGFGSGLPAGLSADMVAPLLS